jgi:threonylcarbamoyladenosine tRNA methylthiotransferase MtaB
MRTFSIVTLGCKVNRYEGQQIRQYLENIGLTFVEPKEKPDLFVINTCCVTATASAKSRQYIQRAVKANPTTVRVICGCLPAIHSRELCPSGNNFHIISRREDLPAMLSQIVIGETNYIRAENGMQIKDGSPSSANFPRLPQLSSFKGQTRAFLKVQDGCDRVCSYCIVPKVRPDVQSKPIDEAVAEAKALVAAGHKEIVVTGVCLGAYGRQTVRRTPEISDLRFMIYDLLTELARVEGLLRIRVSSLEPGDISEELLDVFCAHKNIMPHIHLSVQSGSDAILKRMCRSYTAAELREKIELIKKRLDRPAITCDMIVGFPGETDEDFAETVELAKWAGFSKIHVFPFSSRMGTGASRMKNKVESKIIKQRAQILRKVGDELAFSFREQFINQTCEVLIEGSKDGQAFGHCERYFMVQVNSATKTPSHKEKQNSLVSLCLCGKGEIVKVRITAATEEGAAAEAANSKS